MLLLDNPISFIVMYVFLLLLGTFLDFECSNEAANNLASTS